jgi:polyphosphate kinase
MLEFNRRVLAQARRADVPLLERPRCITIVSSIMDEFFEIRFPDVLEAVRERGAVVRVEVAWPIVEPALRQHVIDECLVPYLGDGRDAWTLRGDGEYTPADGSGPSAQRAPMQRYRPLVEAI